MKKLNIKKILKNTWLCIKYPFLYPRNRFTDEHYNNRKISNKIWDLRNNGIKTISIKVLKEDDFNNELKSLLAKKDNVDRKTTISFDYKGSNITLRHHNIPNCSIELTVIRDGKEIYNTIYKLDEYHIIYNALFYITTRKTLSGDIINPVIYVSVKSIDDAKDNLFKYVTVNIIKYANIKLYLYKKLNSFLGLFHILPSYTELDSLDKGWRIRFGEDICRDIRNSLLHTYTKEIKNKIFISYIIAYVKGIRMLLNYRIEQIKEKYGSLRWYSMGDTEEIHNIINKYETISYNTCIVCGKPAKYITKGWICPYCEEHVPDKDRASLIKKGETPYETINNENPF